MTDRWRTDPTTVLLVCNGVTRHQEPTMGTVMRPGDRSLLSRSELQQGGWPCLPVRMAWWILCRTTAVTVGASATTWMTMLLALGMALLESISYTPGLSAGRTSEELRGAQGSGQTAWFHTSRGSTLTRVLWTFRHLFWGFWLEVTAGGLSMLPDGFPSSQWWNRQVLRCKPLKVAAVFRPRNPCGPHRHTF